MRVVSGDVTKYLYFVALDATDLKTRETGLTNFTVYRSRNGGAAAAYTTPTINETDAANMPGVYELLLDEDMALDAGDDSQEVCLHITHAGMAPVTRTFELYRAKITAGRTLSVESDGDVTKVNVLDGHTPQSGDAYARIGANGAGLSAVPWNAAWDAEVQSEAADALNAYDPPTKTELDAAVAPLATSSALAVVQADTNDIQTRLPAALIGGRMDAHVGEMAPDTVTAAALAADAVAEIQSGLATLALLTTVAGYLDTEVAAILAAAVAIQVKTDNLPAMPAAVGSAMTLTAGERDAIAAAHLDLVDGVEAGVTVRQAQRVQVAAAVAKLSGVDPQQSTNTIRIRDVGDTKDRVTATVDADGNRTAVVLDLS